MITKHNPSISDSSSLLRATKIDENAKLHAPEHAMRLILLASSYLPKKKLFFSMPFSSVPLALRKCKQRSMVKCALSCFS